MKGASRVIGIDKVPARLVFARGKSGVETIDFSKYSDVVKRIQELVPGGLDVAIDCGMLVRAYYSLLCHTHGLNIGTFHEPKTLLHKVEKTLMLETDVSETVNEMIESTKKMGTCGIIAAYAGYTNHFNIGALMEKAIRLIGHGQAPVHKYWRDLLALVESGELDPTLCVSFSTPLSEVLTCTDPQHRHPPCSAGRFPRPLRLVRQAPGWCREGLC